MAGQSGYSKQDMLRMQHEAERRVMEMKERAQSTVGSSAAPEAEPKAEKPKPKPQKVQKPPEKENDGILSGLFSKQGGFLNMLNLKSFFKEQDTTLILLMLVLLSDDDDPLLMLALLYIIM